MSRYRCLRPSAEPVNSHGDARRSWWGEVTPIPRHHNTSISQSDRGCLNTLFIVSCLMPVKSLADAQYMRYDSDRGTAGHPGTTRWTPCIVPCERIWCVQYPTYSPFTAQPHSESLTASLTFVTRLAQSSLLQYDGGWLLWEARAFAFAILRVHR